MTRADMFLALAEYLPPATPLSSALAILRRLDEEVAAAAVEVQPQAQEPPEAVTPMKVAQAPEAQPKKPVPAGLAAFLAPEEFFETECYHGGWVTAKDLYEAYVAFAVAQDLEPLSAVKFGRAAREQFTYKKTAAGGKYETSVEGVDHNA